MKILFLCARFKPSIGGVETHAYEVARRLARKGHEVQVVTEFIPALTVELTHKEIHDDLLKEDVLDRNIHNEDISNELDGVKTTYLSFGHYGFLKKFRIWRKLWQYRNLISQTDAIHCHDVFFWYLPFRFMYPLKKVYTTFHGYEGAFPPTHKAIFIRRVSNTLSHGSINIGDYIEKWYGTKPTMVIYGGIDNIHMSETTSEKDFKKPQEIAKKTTKTLRIVLIGRLSNDIGIKTYVKILKELTKKSIQYTFDIYGDGPLRSLLQKYGKIHGFVSDIRVNIEKADIIFASSYLSIMEALSHGKIVVSVYENELKKDYICDSPFAKWIISGNDAKTLTQSTIENLNKMKKGNKSLVNLELINYLSHNTWDNVTKIYERLWSD